jgi:hypothetical protein
LATDLETVRERLREWARYFRDRAKQGQSGSAEGLWRSPQVWESPNPRPVLDVQRAIRTQLLLQQLPHQYHRALSWRFVAPCLPVGIALRHLSRRLGPRIGPKEYDELVVLGEYRLAALIDREIEKKPAARRSPLGR